MFDLGFLFCFVSKLFFLAFFFFFSPSERFIHGPVAVTLSRMDVVFLDEFWNAAQCKRHNSHGVCL